MTTWGLKTLIGKSLFCHMDGDNRGHNETSVSYYIQHSLYLPHVTYRVYIKTARRFFSLSTELICIKIDTQFFSTCNNNVWAMLSEIYCVSYCSMNFFQYMLMQLLMSLLGTADFHCYEGNFPYTISLL